MPCVFDVKDSADADGTKIAHEQCFLPVFAATREQLVCGEDGWYTAEDKDQNSQADESRICEARSIGIVEVGPWDDCTNVHKSAEIQQDVDARVYFIMSGGSFSKVLAVPVHSIAGNEAGQEVISAQSSTCADNEQP